MALTTGTAPKRIAINCESPHGSDFDGIEVWPEGLDNPDRLPALLELLRDRGYTREQLEKIAGRNYWRVLKTDERMSGRYA